MKIIIIANSKFGQTGRILQRCILKFLMIFFALNLSPCFAADETKSNSQAQAMPSVSISQDLKFLVGNWTGKGTMLDVRTDKNVEWGETETVSSGLDDKFLLMESSGSPDPTGKIFQGKGFITYDPLTSLYLFYWFDTDGFHGKFEGKKQGNTIRYKYDGKSGQNVFMTMMIDSDTQYRIAIEEGGAGTDLKNVMTVTYTKNPIAIPTPPAVQKDKAPSTP